VSAHLATVVEGHAEVVPASLHLAEVGAEGVAPADHPAVGQHLRHRELHVLGEDRHGRRVALGDPVSFGAVSAEQARAFHRWFGHPFTYPVSLLFAAHNDVPIGAYDLMAPNRLLGDPQYPAGRLNIGEAYDEVWTESGWHAPERSGTTSFRWASRTAALIVPLDHAANLRVDVRAQAFNYPGAPPQTVSLIVNGIAQPAVAVRPDWGLASFLVNREAWRSGVNRVALVFEQEARPADVGVGNDTRPLSAAVDYVHLEEIRQP